MGGRDHPGARPGRGRHRRAGPPRAPRHSRRASHALASRPMLTATSPDDARRLGEAFIFLRDTIRDAGTGVAWTVHNLLPHGARFEAEEAAFRGEVAKRADVIDIMASSSARSRGPVLRTSGSTAVARRSHIRATPAASESDTSPGCRRATSWASRPMRSSTSPLGTIRADKGLSQLLDAWDALPEGGPRRLVIAGGVSKSDEQGDLLERAALHPTVLLTRSGSRRSGCRCSSARPTSPCFPTCGRSTAARSCSPSRSACRRSFPRATGSASSSTTDAGGRSSPAASRAWSGRSARPRRSRRPTAGPPPRRSRLASIPGELSLRLLGALRERRSTPTRRRLISGTASGGGTRVVHAGRPCARAARVASAPSLPDDAPWASREPRRSSRSG